MKKLLRTLSLALLAMCGAGFGATGDARADVKIKTRNTSAGQSSEQVVYIKGKRQRTEQNAASVTITQCDLRRSLQLGVPTKTYLMTPFDQKLDANATDAQQQQQSPANAQQPARRGGVVTSTITATDTGERKKMFGYTARRIKTSMITESSPDACQVSRSRVESDGWYIDAAFALDCDNAFSASYTGATQAGGCRDQYRTKQVGLARLGYPALVTTTIFGEDGQASFTFTQEVLEINNAVLDNALFEAPADYRQVSDHSELYGTSAANYAKNNSDDDAASSGGASGSSAGAANSPVSRKRAGVVRVGVPMTMTGLTGDNVNADALAEAVRRALMSNLNNSTIEVITLEAQQPQEAESEAKAKECDYVLYSTVAHKKGGGGGGGFGGFLKKSAAIASGAVAPTSDGGSSGGAARSLKAKDELTLEYKLQRGEERLLANTIKAKAKSDGEDLISQLAGQAATAVRAAAVATK